jgi:hypothetical protein
MDILNLLTSIGKGAWANWSYEVSYVSQGSNSVSSSSNLDGFTYSTDNLRPRTAYTFKVRAYSAEGGHGPWSEQFVGSTLPDERLVPAPKFVWATSRGLAVSDVFGNADFTPFAQIQVMYRKNLFKRSIICF